MSLIGRALDALASIVSAAIGECPDPRCEAVGDESRYCRAVELGEACPRTCGL